MRETLEQWQEIRDRVRYSPSKCWQVVGLSVPEFLHLIDHYESLLLERNGMEVWQRLDRLHTRLDDQILLDTQKTERIKHLERQVELLENGYVVLKGKYEALKEPVSKEEAGIVANSLGYVALPGDELLVNAIISARSVPKESYEI